MCQALETLRTCPTVALVCLRQSGKTTLARSIGGAYFDPEQRADRVRLDLESKGVAAEKALVILGEAQ